jgi:hypothetical protein
MTEASSRKVPAWVSGAMLSVEASRAKPSAVFTSGKSIPTVNRSRVSFTGAISRTPKVMTSST